jgi:hypothetical protein
MVGGGIVGGTDEVGSGPDVGIVGAPSGPTGGGTAASVVNAGTAPSSRGVAASPSAPSPCEVP